MWSPTLSNTNKKINSQPKHHLALSPSLGIPFWINLSLAGGLSGDKNGNTLTWTRFMSGESRLCCLGARAAGSFSLGRFNETLSRAVRTAWWAFFSLVPISLAGCGLFDEAGLWKDNEVRWAKFAEVLPIIKWIDVWRALERCSQIAFSTPIT